MTYGHEDSQEFILETQDGSVVSEDDTDWTTDDGVSSASEVARSSIKHGAHGKARQVDTSEQPRRKPSGATLQSSSSSIGSSSSTCESISPSTGPIKQHRSRTRQSTTTTLESLNSDIEAFFNRAGKKKKKSPPPPLQLSSVVEKKVDSPLLSAAAQYAKMIKDTVLTPSNSAGAQTQESRARSYSEQDARCPTLPSRLDMKSDFSPFSLRFDRNSQKTNRSPAADDQLDHQAMLAAAKQTLHAPPITGYSLLTNSTVRGDFMQQGFPRALPSSTLQTPTSLGKVMASMQERLESELLLLEAEQVRRRRRAASSPHSTRQEKCRSCGEGQGPLRAFAVSFEQEQVQEQTALEHLRSTSTAASRARPVSARTRERLSKKALPPLPKVAAVRAPHVRSSRHSRHPSFRPRTGASGSSSDSIHEQMFASTAESRSTAAPVVELEVSGASVKSPQDVQEEIFDAVVKPSSDERRRSESPREAKRAVPEKAVQPSKPPRPSFTVSRRPSYRPKSILTGNQNIGRGWARQPAGSSKDSIRSRSSITSLTVGLEQLLAPIKHAVVAAARPVRAASILSDGLARKQSSRQEPVRKSSISRPQQSVAHVSPQSHSSKTQSSPDPQLPAYY